MSSVINCNSYCLGKLWGETSLSELSEGETSTELQLGIIFKSLSMNQRSQLANWARSQCLSSCLSGLSSELLVSSFIEEALDSSHPMFSQMRALKYIIVFYHVAY